MVILITGSSHVGKTVLAQKLLEKYKYPYLSIDHLKMGLIRSNNTSLTPLSSDSDLTSYLWPIVKEIIKTTIENDQNLIVEGCYIPVDYAKDFDNKYLDNIKSYFLIMSEKYINNHFEDIIKYGNVIEKRIDNSITIDELIESNAKLLKEVIMNKLDYILIDENYDDLYKKLKL